jgi:hypothetical protein
MSRPSTPVKVPSSAANNTAATLDPDLRSQINSVLLREGHVSKIQDSLLHALNANSTDWPSAVQAHALSLLRSGEVTNFPALLRRVLADIQADSAAAAAAAPAKPTNGNGKTANGDAKKINGAHAAGAAAQPLALPPGGVEEALKATRESLEDICEIDAGPR